MSSARVAAVGDIHWTADAPSDLGPALAEATQGCAALLLAGDLTSRGRTAEAEALVRELRAVAVPIVAVLGNHDLESGHGEDVARILRDARVHVLDGDAVAFDEIGVAGAKGFGGGFGRHALGPFGEDATKAFVREAVDEALKLETALSTLRARHRIALLHYAPIQDTVRGEPLEIYPFLGSTRLEEPIDRLEVDAVVHGHAHYGAPEGRTRGGVPVYNVSLALLRKEGVAPPVRILELGGAPSHAEEELGSVR